MTIIIILLIAISRGSGLYAMIGGRNDGGWDGHGTGLIPLTDLVNYKLTDLMLSFSGFLQSIFRSRSLFPFSLSRSA